MKKNKKNGFTLFELLVSISIIAILTALASVAFSGAQKKARDSRRVQDIKAVQTAAEQYYSQSTFVYPASTDIADWTTSDSQAILNAFPVDPKPPAVYTYTPVADVNGSFTTYCVCAVVENTVNANSGPNCDFVNITSYFCAKNQQ